MKIKALAAMLMLACIFTFAFSTAIYAQDGDTTPIDAEITDVYGGRDGIVSMTFDDGDYSTAVVLNELFERYDLYGTLMMISDRITNLDKWHEVFSQGRLEPQNHSANHINLTQEKGDPANFNEEVYKSEILDSKTTLESYFPEYDIITYAMPNGKMIDEAYEYAKPIYYAIRATTPSVQSLDPDFSDNSGSWYKMHSPVVFQSYFITEDQQWEWIKGCIDNAANGWYAPIIHCVGDVDYTDPPVISQVELTYTMAEKMFGYISELDKEEKVWVTTFSSAVKYVRERQNSTVTAYEQDGSIYVRVTMNEQTEDGKALPLDIFNHPLTVKVKVPDTYGTIFYTTGGVEYSTAPFSEGADNYAYINLIPDGSDVKLRLGSTHEYGQWERYDAETHKRSCIECGLLDYGTHEWSAEGEIIDEPTHYEEGTMLCPCLLCSEQGEQSVPKTDEHEFTRKLTKNIYLAEKENCQHGLIYYYSCRCGERGAETFEVGEKKDHKFGKWKTETPATAESDGLKIRSCDECGLSETEVIPRLNTGGQEPSGDTDGSSLPLIIGISSGAAVLVAGAVVAVIIIKKKKAKV